MTDEEEAIQELRTMSPNELAKVEYTIIKWVCCAKGCERFSRVKDYGASPYYFFKRRFVDLRGHILYCHEHWKVYRQTPEKIIYKEDYHVLP